MKPETKPDGEKNHALRAMEELRRRIFGGEIAGGTRLYEVALAKDLNVSRTPIRDALSRLVEEGLLERGRNTGFIVRSFTFADVVDAIELRGVLEGTAARYAAERGASDEELRAIQRVVTALDGCFDLAADTIDLDRYSQLNSEFHWHLGKLSGSRLLEQEVERVKRLPFASPTAFLPNQQDMPGYVRTLACAQRQHHNIVLAIAARESGRAEALVREHAREARRNLEVLMESGHGKLENLPGHALIKA